MSLVIQFLSVALLGLIGGSVPGPILTSTFTEIVRKGFVKSLHVILYALLSEVTVASLILFIFFSLSIPPKVFYVLSFAGAIVLIWMASQIWSITKLNDKGKLFDFKKIFLLTVFNGPLWIFWSTICVPQAYLLSRKIVGGQLIFLALFELGWLSSTLTLAYLFSKFRPLLTKEGVITKVFKIFAGLLVLFAADMIWTSMSYLFR